jgi:hypothetical protein
LHFLYNLAVTIPLLIGWKVENWRRLRALGTLHICEDPRRGLRGSFAFG